ncbi:hypothetical protein DsansV1_C05g0056801 [Dioscorea sansibarensis]
MKREVMSTIGFSKTRPSFDGVVDLASEGSDVVFVGVFVAVVGGGCVGVLCSDVGGCATCVGALGGGCDGVFGGGCDCGGSFTGPEVMGMSVSLEQQRPILSIFFFFFFFFSSVCLSGGGSIGFYCCVG